MSINKADLLDSEDPSRGVELRVPCYTQIDEQSIRQQLEQDRFFWLDLNDPSEEDIVALAGIFHFHPLALEDVRNFRQRPKLDDYGDYAFLVFYGAHARVEGDDDQLSEVHLFVSGHYLISIRREELPGARRAAQQDRGAGDAQRAVPDLPHPRRAHRQLLPGAVQHRRRDRRARGRA